MDKTQLTIQLPESGLTFLQAYAKRQNKSISELIDQYIQQLQILENYSYHPDIEKGSGQIPKDLDAQKEYYDYIEEKHR